MQNSYKKYKKSFRSFSTKGGYYEACEYLAFQNRWQGIERYIKSIGKAIIDTKKRKQKDGLIMADIACGFYGWLPKHFSEHASKITCIDSNNQALKQIKELDNPIVETLQDDAFTLENTSHLTKGVDFLYTGFNVYEGFIDNFLKLVSVDGCIFLMKPKTGDDLLLRSLLKKYDIFERYKEIEKITLALKGYAEIEYREELFSWTFSKDSLDKILSALSVVSLGSPTTLTSQQYQIGIDFLNLRTQNNKVTLSQTLSIWTAIKK